MATYKKKVVKKKQQHLHHQVAIPTSSLIIVPPIPKGEVMVLDTEELPIMGNFGRAVENTYPKEFALMDSMAVNQSAVFLQGKANIITAVRNRIQKLSSKKFVVKKINSTHSRLWRVPDNSVTRVGGRQATQKAAATNKQRSGWGGKRIPGTGKAHARGPKKNHNGQPIVPAQTELNSVES
jgi:hypothetical protein